MSEFKRGERNIFLKVGVLEFNSLICVILLIYIFFEGGEIVGQIIICRFLDLDK